MKHTLQCLWTSSRRALYSNEQGWGGEGLPAMAPQGPGQYCIVINSCRFGNMPRDIVCVGMGVPLQPFPLPWRGRFCCCHAAGPGSPDERIVLCCKLSLCPGIMVLKIRQRGSRYAWRMKWLLEKASLLSPAPKELTTFPQTKGDDFAQVKWWWHELRGSCFLLLQQGPAG